MKSRTGYWLGGGLIVLGILGAVLWFVGSLVRLSDEVDEFQRVAVPGEATMELDVRKYVVYYESSVGGAAVPPLELEIVDTRSGSPLAISTYDGELTYSFSDHDGTALATVTPARPGAYAVSVRGSVQGGSLAIGRSLAWPIVRGILGAFAVGGLGLVLGGALIGVTGVRRSRARRAGVDPEAQPWFSHRDRPGRP